MFEWLYVSSFKSVILSSIKNNVYKTFAQYNKNVFETIKIINSLGLVCRFYDHNTAFCSLYMISVEIWFMKTSTRIMKYKSRVIKSNSAPTPPSLCLETSRKEEVKKTL